MKLQYYLVLKKLRASDNVSNELSKMYAEAAEINSHKTLGIWQLLRSQEYRLPLICGIVLQFTQQFCGINTVNFSLSIISNVKKLEILNIYLLLF
jgi:hypothetical protein